MPYLNAYNDLIECMKSDGHELNSWAEVIDSQLHGVLVEKPHGDTKRWTAAFDLLPEIEAVQVDLTQDIITLNSENTLSIEDETNLQQALKGLIPWRKGPFNFFGEHIDTEWHSDWKWQRVSPHISSLHDRMILDVGCGSGYHMWRMLGEGARRVIGVDPSYLFLWQFEAVKKYAKAAQGQDVPAHILPMKLEDIPHRLKAFDTVFSMGVLYHRRSPLDHLSELYNALREGGEVVLETLVIEGGLGDVLMPEDRYAMMRNVWFIPSTATLALWMRRVGFKDVRVVEQNYTSVDEQRSTEWMKFNSLKDFLDPKDATKTVEGYPAPLRATLIART